MTLFEQIKDLVDIQDAAQRYGLVINRHNKAICPYHGDTNPSLSFRNQRFKCFSCDKSGDVIDLVGCLVNKSPLEVAEELNTAYHLGIAVNEPPDRVESLNRQHMQAERKRFLMWEQLAFNTYVAYLWRLRDWRISCAPQYPDEPQNPLFVESCTMLDYTEYLLQTVFIEGDLSVKMHFYLTHRQKTERLAARLKQIQEQTAATLINFADICDLPYPKVAYARMAA